MELLSLLLLGVLVVISPGADFVLVLQNSLNNGRKAGILSALGIAIAISIHIAYSLFGIGYLISQNEFVFNLVRYSGAAYLIFLGCKGLFASKGKTEMQINESKSAPLWRFLLQGFLCNVLNPKTMLFFVSIFSQVITLQADSYNAALLYGVYMIVLHGIWFSIVAIVFTSPRLQLVLLRMKHRLNQACGLGLLCFGAVLGLK